MERKKNPPKSPTKSETQKRRGARFEEQESRETAKERATRKADEKEKASRRLSAQKPKDDDFIMPPKEDSSGRAVLLEDWMEDKNNYKHDAKGKALADAEDAINITLADKGKSGRKVPADWVVTRTKSGGLAEVDVSGLQNKSAAEKAIPDSAEKPEDDKTDEEKAMDKELKEMGEELAKINKDAGAYSAPDTGGDAGEARAAEGKRLQEMREQLRVLRMKGNDQSINRMEAELAKAQMKWDHPEIATNGQVEYDAEGLRVTNGAKFRPADPGTGIVGDGMRRRKSRGYTNGAFDITALHMWFKPRANASQIGKTVHQVTPPDGRPHRGMIATVSAISTTTLSHIPTRAHRHPNRKLVDDVLEMDQSHRLGKPIRRQKTKKLWTMAPGPIAQWLRHDKGA
jgi:hypothetical protein